MPSDERRSELVCLTDLFGIATGAAGKAEIRQGIDLFEVLAGSAQPREAVVDFYGEPGAGPFKIMVRDARWKYISFANGGKEQLFDLQSDPRELRNLAKTNPGVVAQLREKGISDCRQPGARDALEKDDLKVLPFTKWQWNGERAYQFDRSKGISGFPKNPGDVLTRKSHRFSG